MENRVIRQRVVSGPGDTAVGTARANGTQPVKDIGPI